jgi:hypothetical protein
MALTDTRGTSGHSLVAVIGDKNLKAIVTMEERPLRSERDSTITGIEASPQELKIRRGIVVYK